MLRGPFVRRIIMSCGGRSTSRKRHFCVVDFSFKR